MKPPSKKLWVALIAAIVIVAVISIVTGKDANEARQLGDSNLVFVNDSGTPVGSVGYSFSRYDGTVESGGGCNADGSLLKRGDRLHFEVRFPAAVTLYADVEGREPITALVVEETPPGSLEEGVWYVILRDGGDGTSAVTLSLNLDEEELVSMQKGISEELGVDVSGGVIDYCWYPGHGIQGDGEDFVTLRFSQQAGAALAEALSAAEGWQAGTFPEALKAETFVSVHSHESLIRWDEVSVSGWYCFRDKNGGTGSYRTADYAAAVYDPESRTLYFFEWHQ